MMKKFENVNVIDTLRTINIQNARNNLTDFQFDVKMLTEASEIKTKPRSFLWMSYNDGTWCFPARDVYIRNTPAHHTWRYCSLMDGAKAFWIELDKKQSGEVTGRIVELDYAKHYDDVEHNSFFADSVELTYRFPNRSRTYNIVDYNELRQAIQDRYGDVYKVEYKVADEDALTRMIDETSRNFFANAEPISLNAYRDGMIQERFGHLDRVPADETDAGLIDYDVQPEDEYDEEI